MKTDVEVQESLFLVDVENGNQEKSWCEEREGFDDLCGGGSLSLFERERRKGVRIIERDDALSSTPPTGPGPQLVLTATRTPLFQSQIATPPSVFVSSAAFACRATMSS